MKVGLAADHGGFEMKQQLAKVIVAGHVLLCGSGVGASVAANKIVGVRAAVCHDDFSTRQGVEDDDLNILCFGGRTTGLAVAWDCAKSFLNAQFSGAERHCRRLAKVAQLEAAWFPMVTASRH